MSVRPASGSDLSRADVEALAAPLGVGWRTLELWTRQGLIAPAMRTGHGRGQGAEFRRPAVAARQIEELVEARKHTHSWVGLRHWMWWEGLPIEWERWRADRMRELARGYRVRDRLQRMTEHQRAREASVLEGLWRDRRPRPARLEEVWTAPTDIREAVATWVIDTLVGDGGLPGDLSSPFDEGLSVGQVIDHIFGAQRLRERGVLVPGGPGELLSRWVAATPTLTQLARDFALLTESKAKKLRDEVKELEGCAGGRFYLPRQRSREWPELAAISLPLMAWWLMAMRAQGDRSSA